MLQDEVVPGWMNDETFLQGLGLAQSMPGPLFNFSAYLGAVYQRIPGALIAYCGLFGPGVILIFAVVPFWARLRHVMAFKAVLKGLNATAIGVRKGVVSENIFVHNLINAHRLFCVVRNSWSWLLV